MRHTLRQGILATAILILGVLPSPGYTNVRYVPASQQPTGHLSDLAHIEIYGEITKDDIDEVMTLVEKMRVSDPMRHTVPVFLNSPGGDLVAAMEIGNILRRSHAWTIVSNYRECSSACIFILASGVQRNAFNGAKLGLHRPRFDQALFARLSAPEATDLYNRLLEECRSYLRGMGIADQLLDDMLKTESRRVTYKDRNYAERVSLVGEDPAFQEWLRARSIREEGEAVVHAQEFRVDCYNSGAPQDACDQRYYEMLRSIDRNR